jgi:hypothetical protein
MSRIDTSYSNLYEGLATLDQDTGQPPETRMSDPTQMRDMVVRAIRYDMTQRDWKRSRIKGLVDGNPPYNQAKLIEAGRGDECNVNWRIARYFLNLAKGLLYDVTAEEETFASVVLDPDKIMFEARQQRNASNGIITPSMDQIGDWEFDTNAEFDRLQRRDPDWDWNQQMSQGQTVLYGNGPLIFEDELDWRPWAFESRSLLVPEWARSNPNKWEWAALIVEYTPDKLYGHIKNAQAAQARGANVPAIRRAIMHAHPLTRTGVMYQNWSWHQDLLKNNTYYYADQSKLIRTAHFFFREFPQDGEDDGRISECMIDLDGLEGKEGTQLEFLFRKPRKYANWAEAIHPMYWDHDVNGYHHSVSGLGIEMWAALEYENRLLCNLANDAFAPKIFFKPTTASEREKMSIAHVGRYGILPAALEMIQQHVQPMLQDGIAMHREVQSIVSSNLSQFRTNALTKQQGNPVTARQIDYEASEQAKMGNTQLNRIYEQWDWLYAEKYRRATNPKLTKDVRGGTEALEFVERCKRRGIPAYAIRCTDSVKSTRVVGQGSQYLRQQALQFLLGMVQMLPESGRQSLIRDVIASRAGQAKVERYAPRDPSMDSSLAQQQEVAMLQVASMKVAVPPVPTPTQNPLIFANAFVQAAEGAAQGMMQGGDPHEALSFLQLCIPAAEGHIQRLAQDQSRLPVAKQLMQRLEKVKQVQAQAMAAMQQAQQQQEEQAQQMNQLQNGQDPDTQIGLAKVGAKHRVDLAKLAAHTDIQQRKLAIDSTLKAGELQHDLALDRHRSAVDTHLADAETAAGIHRDDAVARAKINGAKQTTATE